MRYKVSVFVEEQDVPVAVSALVRFGKITTEAVQPKIKSETFKHEELSVVVPFAVHERMQPERVIRHDRSGNGTFISDTFRGRLALSAFKTLPLVRAADIIELFIKNNYQATTASSVLIELEKEGVIVRAKRGLYRAPDVRPLPVAAQSA